MPFFVEAVLKKCRAALPDIPKNYPLTSFDGHCVIGGVSELKGHTVVAIGAPGDNRGAWVHAMGDKTREIAMGYHAPRSSREKAGSSTTSGTPTESEACVPQRAA